ncbi:hypothetical protein PENTCL1PPCAC_10072, partial [Pristionchus entomophagus]
QAGGRCQGAGPVAQRVDQGRRHLECPRIGSRRRAQHLDRHRDHLHAVSHQLDPLRSREAHLKCALAQPYRRRSALGPSAMQALTDYAKTLPELVGLTGEKNIAEKK